MTETEHGGAADDQADIRICTSCGRVHTERECEQIRETSDRSDEAVEEPLAGAAPTRLLPRGAELHTG